MAVSSILDSVKHCAFPVVIKGVLNWPQLEWDLPTWSSNLQAESRKYPVRKGSFGCSKQPHWERDCEIVNLSMKDLFDLMEKENDALLEYWYYFDYKHLQQWFQDNSFLNDILWSTLGLSEEADSTIWIGTKGAHTPCHFDSYGHNFVAQLYGRKRWLLFPPSMTNKLKPSRVPYEESSIYSSINFFCGCSDHSSLNEAWCVDLLPGEILYVPRHWWHYVEHETSSISINTWLPLECDAVSRLEESLVKSLMSCFIKDLPIEQRNNILNPNEDDLPGTLCLEEINYCWEHYHLQKENLIYQYKEIAENEQIVKVDKIPGKSVKSMLEKKCSDKKRKTFETKTLLDVSTIINAFCHPEVLQIVLKKLKPV